MSLSGSLEGAIWEHHGIKVQGLSLSGVRTSLCLPEQHIAFDVAQGLPFAINMRSFFISHGHLDHAAGIPYIISQKTLIKAPIADFYMPASLVEPMNKMMEIWQKVEGHKYEYRFHAIDENSRIELNPSYSVRPFRTSHRIDSFGYALLHKKKKLKPEYSHLSKSELVQAKKSGTIIDQHSETIEFAFTGDTKIDFLDINPWLAQAKILCMECTYLDERRNIEHARRWGHTHLDEIIPRLRNIQSEKILLIHLSSRYSLKEAEQILKSRIPASHYQQVTLFPGQ
jgi:ribonuclease Z